MAATTSLQRSPAGEGWFKHWPLLLGFAALAIPTIVSLGKQVWTRESGAHGPIILATGGWLVWREAASFRELAKPGTPWLTAGGTVGRPVFFVFGRGFC